LGAYSKENFSLVRKAKIQFTTHLQRTVENAQPESSRTVDKVFHGAGGSRAKPTGHTAYHGKPYRLTKLSVTAIRYPEQVKYNSMNITQDVSTTQQGAYELSSLYIIRGISTP
jgi:hypothetical protein